MVFLIDKMALSRDIPRWRACPDEIGKVGAGLLDNLHIKLVFLLYLNFYLLIHLYFLYPICILCIIQKLTALKIDIYSH